MARYSEESAALVLGEIHQREVVALLSRLIQFPTVNPPGDVRDAVTHCAEVLQAEGFETRTVRVVETKPHLIAEYGPGDGPVLCFNAHLDVVPPGQVEEWTYPPFGGVVAHERVYGRGAGDDKASVTAQVMAGIALARSGVPIRGKLVINEVADEETAGPAGVIAVIESKEIVPDFVIVGEQTMNRVAIGEKGYSGCEIVVHGKTAHGGMPWEGANAIEGMAEVIVALRRELWPQLKHRTHPYFQPSAGTVNMIEGGVARNVVPDRCEIYIDRRAMPGEDLNQSIAEVREIAERAIAHAPGTTVDVLTPRAFPAVMSEPDAAHVQAMVNANRYLDLDTELTAFNMGSDGRFFAAAGYPTIIYGPGDPRIAHIRDEWVGIEEVMQATRAYALAALELLGV